MGGLQGFPIQRAAACRQIPAALAQKKLLAAITDSNIAVVDLDDTLGRLALDMSTRDELQYGLQCYLGTVAFRETTAQQEKELKVIKDKKTKEIYKEDKDKHQLTSLNYWRRTPVIDWAHRPSATDELRETVWHVNQRNDWAYPPTAAD